MVRDRCREVKMLSVTDKNTAISDFIYLFILLASVSEYSIWCKMRNADHGPAHCSDNPEKEISHWHTGVFQHRTHLTNNNDDDDDDELRYIYTRLHLEGFGGWHDLILRVLSPGFRFPDRESRSIFIQLNFKTSGLMDLKKQQQQQKNKQTKKLCACRPWCIACVPAE